MWLDVVKKLAAAVGVQMVAAAVDETVRVKIRKHFKKDSDEGSDLTPPQQS